MSAITATHPARAHRRVHQSQSEQGAPPQARLQAQPRAHGRVRIAARLRAGKPVLAELHQRGSARALFPHERSGELAAVLLNTAGGVTGGDRFACEAQTADGTALTLTTQAAERAYRAQPGEVARIDTRLVLGAASRIDWLPQETILFDGAALERSLTVDMAADARLLAVEAVILGRRAMGEQVLCAHLIDRWRIRRAGRLVYADTLRLSGPVAAIAAGPAAFGPNRVAATVVYVCPDAADRVSAARAFLSEAEDTSGVEAAASVRDGVLVARLLAPDAHRLRRVLVGLLSGLRGAPLPRVWTI